MYERLHVAAEADPVPYVFEHTAQAAAVVRIFKEMLARFV